MNAAQRFKKKVQPDLDAALAAADIKTMRSHVESIGKALTEAARRSPRLPRPEVPGRSKADKAAAKKARRKTLSEIRVELHAETGGMCAICNLGLPFVRMHAHHILSGPERQLEERRETMAPLHEGCHEWVHGRDARFDQREALVRLLEWCETTGRTLAAESTRRRTGKLDEARASVPIKVVVR